MAYLNANIPVEYAFANFLEHIVIQNIYIQIRRDNLFIWVCNTRIAKGETLIFMTK